MKHFYYYMALVLLAGCGDTPDGPKAKGLMVYPEKILTEQVIKNYTGDYTFLDGHLVINDNATFAMEIKQSVRLAFGQKIPPTSATKINCQSKMSGKIDILARGPDLLFRFYPLQMTVADLTTPETSKISPPTSAASSEASVAPDKILKNQNCSQWEQQARSGFDYTFVKLNPTTFTLTPATEIPFELEGQKVTLTIEDFTSHPLGQIASTTNKEVSITDYVMERLQGFVVPEDQKLNGKYSARELFFNPKEGSVLLINNICGFSGQFSADVRVKNSEIKIYPQSTFESVALKTEASEAFKDMRPASCSEELKFFGNAFFSQGVAVKASNQSTVSFQYLNLSVEQKKLN